MAGLTFLDLGAENGASSAPPALQDFFRGARHFPPGPPNFSPRIRCGSNVLQHFPPNDDTPQSGCKSFPCRVAVWTAQGGVFTWRSNGKGAVCRVGEIRAWVDIHGSPEGPATKSGLRNPLIEIICIGLSWGADQCGFN